MFTHCRTVVRPLQAVCSNGDADDNQTALKAPPAARITEFGMPVSRPIFIQQRTQT
jgi:hypothetical protein